jgi:hypothetical protein
MVAADATGVVADVVLEQPPSTARVRADVRMTARRFMTASFA